MQTTFTEAQLADPQVARSNQILRKCVHCGFCTATCPTYVTLGDELDSPRGRIYLIKQMLEQGRPADEKTVKHIDRCLSCLACMTTCPSGVHYMHLVDHAREHIEKTYRRPWDDRALRWLLSVVLPYPTRFRLAILGAWAAKPFARFLPRKLRAMVEFAPATLPPPSPMDRPQVFPAQGPRRARMALMTGCAQRALDTDINEATIRLLTRHGVEVVVAEGQGCCGALTHHMGKTGLAHATAARNIRAWVREMDGAGLDAVVINASGCGTTVKDYGHMFRTEAGLAGDAARVSAITRDISEVMVALELSAPDKAPALRVAYHAACSLQHGQKIRAHPKTLLKSAGFEVVEPAESHLCCGSAGTYNLTQPEIAAQLKERKAANLAATAPQVIAAGNIGCIAQIASTRIAPVVHTVELLDWATGGPKPAKLTAAGL
ncbi:glycolate oxidase subunit GlcF [Rubrimonas cliftonensis]|uniref:Glycolate oxidase iron-sulfur subunit n=1 Tax=Rubrimonas cliftonensis TaxID=89524 RepID=A0A1H4EJU4_9RHOB|nr:glycolate oxidase subunit GlcF [Rubrimonas cliftonensis]SEA84948.1 glycolate oxidase iron-sulfur subunit [Rubrimonas cliftonensis]